MSKGVYEHELRHGHSGAGGRRKPSPTWNSWNAMRDRCQNPNHKAYPRYGGRGITIHEPWNSFKQFLADMGERPSQQYCLNRLDHDLGYIPGNVTWALKRENDDESLPRARRAKTRAQ